MVGKGLIGILITFSIVLAALSVGTSHAETRAFENYDMENLPPQDQNGNYTLDDDDEWTITDQGYLESSIILLDESVLIIVHANLTVNGTIWAKDSSSITIDSSHVVLYVPPSPPVPTEEQYDNPNGFVLIEDEATIDIDNSSVYMDRHQIERLDLEGLMYPGEVFVTFGDIKLSNSYLNTNGSMTPFNTTIIRNFTRGVVFHLNCEFNVTDTIFTSGIVFYVNAHGTIHNTTLRSLSMQKNNAETTVVVSDSTVNRSVVIDEFSNAVLSNCNLESILNVEGWSNARLINTTVQGLIMNENGTLIMDNSRITEKPQRSHWDQIWDNCHITLTNSSFIEELTFHHNSSLLMTDSTINNTNLEGNINATLFSSVINDLSAGDNTSVWLLNSELNSYQLDDDAKICNTTILTVGVILNEQPLQVPVIVRDNSGTSIGSSTTNEKGHVEFTLIRDMIFYDEAANRTVFSPQITNCIVEVDWETMHREEAVDIEGDYVNVELEFEDYNPPSIEDVKFSTDPYLNTDEDVLTSVHVEEGESSIKHVILKYSTDDGTTWNNLTMYNTGGNIYENSIPGQAVGKKVRFYIIAEDRCGNKMESQYFAYTTGEGLILLNNLIVIIAFIVVLGLIILFSSRAILGKNREKKYLHRTDK
jgi:hypothetical protein